MKTGRKVQVHVCCEFPTPPLLRFLVLRRPPERGGFWAPVTGNVDPGEQLEACARRELLEETGIEQLAWLRSVSEFGYEKDGRHFHETVFVGQAPECDVSLSSEHDEYRWEAYPVARELIHYQSNKEALDQAVQSLGEAKP